MVNPKFEKPESCPLTSTYLEYGGCFAAHILKQELRYAYLGKKDNGIERIMRTYTCTHPDYIEALWEALHYLSLRS